MFLVGLTGGIAAGKSTVAAYFAAQGAVIIDADQLAREVVSPGQHTLVALENSFGPEIINSDGSLNRPKLAELTFGNDSKVALLNDIVHPAVHHLFAERIREAQDNDPDAIIVYDVPLLAEADRAKEFDYIVVVDAPEEVRIDRLINVRHMPPEQAIARVSAQAQSSTRNALADVVIDSSGSVSYTLEQSAHVWSAIERMATTDD